MTQRTSVPQFCHFLVGCSPLRIFRRLADFDLSKSRALYFLFPYFEGKQKSFRKNKPTITFAFVTVIENVLPGIPSQSGQREVNLCWAPYPTNTVQEVHIPIPCSDNILYKNIPKVSRFVFLPKGGGGENTVQKICSCISFMNTK